MPETTAPVIFSAHGVARSVPETAEARGLFAIDATCPLVTKVHREARDPLEARPRDRARRPSRPSGGHRHDGATAGRCGPPCRDARATSPASAPRDPAALAYVTQTTLSVDDTRDIVEALKARFPAIIGPPKEDICYATTNRQEAVKAVAPRVDAMIVVGAPNSSNSLRLREVAERAGCRLAVLVQRAADIDWAQFGSIVLARRRGRRLGARDPGRGDPRRLRRALRGERRDRLDGRRKRFLPAPARTARIRGLSGAEARPPPGNA